MALAMAALIVLVLTTAGPAQAWEREGLLPAPDAEGTYRVITRDPATTTSDCIGRPVTPLCAVETFIACRTREDRKLCEIAVDQSIYPWPDTLRIRKNVNPSFYSDQFNLGATRDEFRFVEARQSFAVGHIPHRPPRLEGDIAIELIRRSCDDDLPQCRPIWRRAVVYITRQTADGWQVVDWGPWDGRKTVIDHSHPEVPLKVVSPVDRKVDPNCVGTATRPECAVESLIACRGLRRWSLCKIALGDYAEADFVTGGVKRRLEYKILFVRGYSDTVLKKFRNKPPEIWPSLGSKIVEVRERSCDAYRKPCDGYFNWRTYIAEPIDGKWRVIDDDRFLSIVDVD